MTDVQCQITAEFLRLIFNASLMITVNVLLKTSKKRIFFTVNLKFATNGIN